MKTMTTFEKLLKTEKQKRIAKTLCQICNHPIGAKPYIMFEERYFHSVCLKKEDKQDR
jgi:hypothetical protein